MMNTNDLRNPAYMKRWYDQVGSDQVGSEMADEIEKYEKRIATLIDLYEEKLIKIATRCKEEIKTAQQDIDSVKLHGNPYGYTTHDNTYFLSCLETHMKMLELLEE